MLRILLSKSSSLPSFLSLSNNKLSLNNKLTLDNKFTRLFNSSSSTTDTTTDNNVNDSDLDFKPIHKVNASNINKDANDNTEKVALEKIKDDLSNHHVFLYMKGHPISPACGFSNQVVKILNKENVKFGSRNVLEEADIREAIKVYSNWPTIPQLYINGEFIGGCDIVTTLYQSGELSDLLKKKL